MTLSHDPKSGSTPANDADLRDADNPFGSGEWNARAVRSSDYPNAQPFGYYTNPAVSPDGNPLRANDEPDDPRTAYMAGGLRNVYGERFGDFRFDGEGGSPADVNDDEGYGRSGNGRS